MFSTIFKQKFTYKNNSSVFYKRFNDRKVIITILNNPVRCNSNKINSNKSKNDNQDMNIN